MTSTKKLSPEDHLLRAVAIVIRKRRESLDMTQGECARESGLHRSYISDLEAGRRNLSIANLSRLAETLHMMPSKLVSFAEKEVKSKGSNRAGRVQSSTQIVKAQASTRAGKSQATMRTVKSLPSSRAVVVQSSARAGKAQSSTPAGKKQTSSKASKPQLSAQPKRRAFAEPLSEAELDVLRLVTKGFANKQIGVKLGIAVDTVKSRIKRLMAKLHVHNRTAAATIFLLQLNDGKGV